MFTFAFAAKYAVLANYRMEQEIILKLMDYEEF